jgi:hypothetical protein
MKTTQNNFAYDLIKCISKNKMYLMFIIQSLNMKKYSFKSNK